MQGQHFPMIVSHEIEEYAGKLANQYREPGLSKEERLKDIAETKAMINQRREAIATLSQGQPGPNEYRVIFNLEEQIASLSTLLPKRGRPVDWRLGLFVTSLANFIEKKTEKCHWLLVTDIVTKHLGLSIASDEKSRWNWSYDIAHRFWGDCEGPGEIIITLPPPLPPPTNPLPKPENENSKSLH